MNITKLEAEMLSKIARSDFAVANGGEPETLDDIGEVWADVIIETPRDKGVFTSLQGKGLAAHSGGPKREAGVWLTQAGFEAYKASR